MLTINKKVIKKFPPPYKWNVTPYKQYNFSSETLIALKHKTRIFQNVCKTIFIGDMSVGKSNILKRFCCENYENNYKETIGVDFEIEYFQILNEIFTLQIWDTAGQKRFQCIAEEYYRNSNVIVTVFDCTKKETLLSASKLLTTALNANKLNRKPLIFLVGTKSDELTTGELDTIEFFAAQKAKKMQAEYWSVSAKTGHHVVELFQRIVGLAFDNSVKSSMKQLNNKNI